MLAFIVRAALTHRAIVLFATLGLVLIGLATSRDAPLDVFPEFAPPRIEIQTEAPGLSTEAVERLVSVPIEAALSNVADLDTLRSKSVLGLSAVTLLFPSGTDIDAARQQVQERLGQLAGQLPAAARTPVMLASLSSTSRVMKIGISSDTIDRMALSQLVRWTIRPRLMTVPGVANIAVWGQRDRQLQVLAEPERLQSAGITLNELRGATTDALVVGSGGFIDSANQRLAVQQRSTVQNRDDLDTALVKTVNGAGIQIGDVATVVEGVAPPIGSAVIDDRLGLMLIVEKQPGSNTLALTHEVEAAIDALRPGLDDIDIDTTIFRPATFIERAIDNLTHALLLGCVLVALILFLFTRDWRQALISLCAIPLSLLAAVVVLLACGATLNTMVIAGLVIALGEVVDDAVIDVENIARRLRLNQAAETPRPVFDVVLRASLEVRSSVVFASLIVMLVFVPVLFMQGVSGAFFQPLALAYVLAIAASLLVALIITPAMCLVLLPGAPAGAVGETRLAAGIKRLYWRGLGPLVVRPRLAVLSLLVGLMASGIGYAGFKQALLPDFHETDFLMHWVEKPATSIEAMERITLRVSDELRDVAGVRNFGAHIGRAEAADEVVGPNFTELWISLADTADYDASVARIKQVIHGYPGLFRDVLTYLRERIKEVLSGTGASIVVRVFGPNQAQLRDTAQAVRGALGDINGVTDLHVEQQVQVPQVQIQPKPAALALVGLTAGALQQQVQTLIAGQRVGQVFEDQTPFDVTLWSPATLRRDPQALSALLIQNPAGPAVRLGDIANVYVAPAPNAIQRENSQRRIDISMNITGADLENTAQAIERAVADLAFPRGYHPEILGEYAALKDARGRLAGIGALCLIAIIWLVWLAFRSYRMTLLVTASLPFALVGGVAIVALTGGALSLGSLVGFVAVIGIAARNGIMLLSHAEYLRCVEQMPFGVDLVRRAAAERVIPILMTALCAALALLPLVIRGDVPGHEIEHPMALVILGGLVSSTLLNLFLLPALYLRYAVAPGART